MVTYAELFQEGKKGRLPTTCVSYIVIFSFCSFGNYVCFLSLLAPLPAGFTDTPHPLAATPSNLVYHACTTHVELLFFSSVWNCWSVVKNPEFISAYTALKSLDFLALTLTWITPENTATPAALFTGLFSLIV